MAQVNTKQVLPQDGALFDTENLTENYFTMVPDGDATGRSLAKRPQSGAWNAFTVYPNFARMGYVTARIEGTSVKVRIPLLDHPDGG